MVNIHPPMSTRRVTRTLCPGGLCIPFIYPAGGYRKSLIFHFISARKQILKSRIYRDKEKIRALNKQVLKKF